MDDKQYFAARALAERKAALAAKDVTSFRIHMELATAYERRAAVANSAADDEVARTSPPQPVSASLAQEQAWKHASDPRLTKSVRPVPLLRN
jgi:hypothetical protein